jgi:hypothetical protein
MRDRDVLLDASDEVLPPPLQPASISPAANRHKKI